MNLEQQFTKHLKTLPFIQKNTTHLVAVSGGADSVVLCYLLHRAGYSFDMAHGNFQLRNDESTRDEIFVKQLAEQLGKKLFINRFDTQQFADENKLSIQVAARELRYNWFRKIIGAEQLSDGGKKYIFTAHHADDNIETVTMNFFRGTGLKGLTGMDSEFQQIVRPLLPFKKQVLLDYAHIHSLSFVEDSSNANSYYTRNFFRNEMLPAIKKVFPQVEENVVKNIERLGEAAVIYDTAITNYKKKLIEIKGNEQHIAILKLQKLPAFKTILWEIIQPFNFTAAQTSEAIKLFQADNGSHVDSATHRIIKNRRWLIITTLQAPAQNANLVLSAWDASITFAEGEIKLEAVSIEKFSINPQKHVAAIDAAIVTFPLLLRKWKQGDYFYPLGMQKKKKVSRFLIDQKMSATQKEHIWILESNSRIVWIVDQRMDDRFKITNQTKSVLQITLNPL